MPALPLSPVAPISQPAPVRAGFLDIRAQGTGFAWHRGADVAINRDACAADAPAGACVRVYALRAGTVFLRIGLATTCNGLVRAGVVGYGHVMPRVSVGQRVAAGQLIGWSCRSESHVHIGNFVQAPCGAPKWSACVFRDPLAEGGAMYAPGDTTGPTIEPVLEDGYVDAVIEDARAPGWMTGQYAGMAGPMPPARVQVNGVDLVNAAWLQEGGELPPVGAVYAPETRRNTVAGMCAIHLTTCEPDYFDFRLVPDVPGETVTIRAWDSAGNETTEVVSR